MLEKEKIRGLERRDEKIGEVEREGDGERGERRRWGKRREKEMGKEEREGDGERGERRRWGKRREKEIGEEEREGDRERGERRRSGKRREKEMGKRRDEEIGEVEREGERDGEEERTRERRRGEKRGRERYGLLIDSLPPAAAGLHPSQECPGYTSALGADGFTSLYYPDTDHIPYKSHNEAKRSRHLVCSCPLPVPWSRDDFLSTNPDLLLYF
ncbi:hypothetical protein NHX12_011196 [Muraenolepis orangiensis]|uniref:Uncharacterized protein n=1 Tax=Muraenolepis orangiensis TaxID=630683 RepID=A0A9Q0DES2_9TELE|nr:hypothetical protein NHX12_011196 [Muraenolepis orangiensis]